MLKKVILSLAILSITITPSYAESRIERLANAVIEAEKDVGTTVSKCFHPTSTYVPGSLRIEATKDASLIITFSYQGGFTGNEYSLKAEMVLYDNGKVSTFVIEDTGPKFGPIGHVNFCDGIFNFD